jgi:hypothetical protein
MTASSIAQVTSQIYDLLAGFSAEERSRVLAATVALFGDAPVKTQAGDGTQGSDSGGEDDFPGLGVKAKRWIRQEKVSLDELNEVYHIGDDGTVELIATDIPGATKKEQAGNVYLLSGIRSLLASDEPTIANTAAVAYCQHIGCHDTKNHATNRSALGNKLTGSVATGFTLPAPGLKAAAAVIKAIAKKES